MAIGILSTQFYYIWYFPPLLRYQYQITYCRTSATE